MTGASEHVRVNGRGTGVVHLLVGTGDVGLTKCGIVWSDDRAIRYSIHRDEVTCKRCNRRMALVLEPVVEEAEMPDPQVAAIDQERNHTRTEVLAFLREGDLSAAIFRMHRGFQRQCRLAGLDRALRESMEKENA